MENFVISLVCEGLNGDDDLIVCEMGLQAPNMEAAKARVLDLLDSSMFVKVYIDGVFQMVQGGPVL